MCELAKDTSGEIQACAEKLYLLLDENDRAGDELIRRRLDICMECDKRSEDTCLKCGCYVLIRAIAVKSVCPAKKW